MAIPTRKEDGLTEGLIVLNVDLTSIFDAIYTSASAGVVFRLLDSSGNLLIDTDDSDSAWASLLGLSGPKRNIDREAHLKKLIALADDDVVDQHRSDTERLERLNGLLSTGKETYYIHTYLSDSYLHKLSRDALLGQLPILILLLLFSLAVAVYVYRYDRKLNELNSDLQFQVDEVKKVNLYKSNFLANMSHEIRTPLTSIMGLLEIIRRNPDAENLSRNIDVASAAARNLLLLINDILDLSRVESGRIKLESSELSIDPLVDSSMVLFSNEAQAKGIELISEVAPELSSLSFSGDALRVQQLLNNLIGNAVKFTTKGSVTVSVDLIARSDNSATIQFCVADTGIGIDVAELSQLCEPFVQADVSVTRKYGGSGLGLSITRHLLELMDSQLHVESRLTEGSRFSFILRLPVVAELSAEIVKLRTELPKRVLIVEENPRVCEVLDKMFSYWGCKTSALFSSEAAFYAVVERADSGEQFDLLIVEKRLSETDGAALIQRINTYLDSRAHARPQEILMALEVDHAEVLSAPDLAGVTILQKPVTMSRLLEALGKKNVISLIRAAGTESDLVEVLIGVLREKLSWASAPKILLADDNAYNRVLLEELFGSFGLSVTMVNDGMEALKQVQNKQFDIVFLDIQMPVMDGLTAARAMRKVYSETELPIIALSAATFDSDIEEAVAAGFNAHIAKPINVEKLINTILQYWTPLSASPEIGTQSFKKEVGSGSALSLDGLFAMPEFTSVNPMYQYIGEKAYRRVAVAFVKDMEKELVSCENNPELSIRDQQRLFHRLTGAAASVGAVRLAELNSEMIEQASKDPNLSLRPLFDAIKQAIKILRVYVDVPEDEN
nr:hybrid sensor histidine kinase/response regulator [Zhongshania aquimaris]